ncbi:hypothetical protein DYB32_005070 [Aphanomyces invadans]|uniref:Uncharacterized protein n=1 Tax=Aphanomyces invadans TaxID=157072 RepID=A0A418AVK6_9STRA|nr:hypothetical protein DYB32_005070 [Aphanomyces invadans]
MPLGILRFGVDGGATSSMVRRFTIVDHLTSTATDSPSSYEEDVAPLGLSDFLKEIEYPTISGSEQRPTTTSFAPAAAPAATGNSVGDDVVPSVGLPCSDEDDVMDPDELYRRILLQHPDLTAPLLTGVPVANAEATPCHPDVSDQALDAIETSDEPVILYQRVLKRLREILQAPATTIGQPRSCHESHGGDSPPCTPATAPPLGAQMSLLQFHQKLQLQAEQKALQVLLGKSMDFDASAYLRYVLQQQQPKPSCPPPRRHSNFVCAGNAHVQGLRPIQSVAQIQINVKAKVRPATGGSVRRDSAPDTKKPMPALCRPLIHPKSAGKDKVRSVHPLPQL